MKINLKGLLKTSCIFPQVQTNRNPERSAGPPSGQHPEEDQPAQAEDQGGHLSLAQRKLTVIYRVMITYRVSWISCPKTPVYRKGFLLDKISGPLCA